jgi:hypothetical protein
MTMGIFELINLIRMTNLTINQIGHFIKLNLKIPPNPIG